MNVSYISKMMNYISIVTSLCRIIKGQIYSCHLDCYPKWRPYCLCIVTILLCLTLNTASATNLSDSKTPDYFRAKVNLTYYDSKMKKIVSEMKEMGNYVTNAKLDSESGEVFHVQTIKNISDGCDEIVNAPPNNKKWIALIERGVCTFKEKLEMARKFNACAVVFYDHKESNGENQIVPFLENVDHIGSDVVTIFISKKEGKNIVSILKEGHPVKMEISVGKKIYNEDKIDELASTNNISRTSVLFVSISFIVLMIISLAWLVFYYIQRFRYAHAKERLTRRLASAAKKAIAKIPQRTVKLGDKELESEFDQCAVCIEGYKASDVIRILPCKHIFHKSCVDPWLLEQRSCPMCKLDILREYGMQVHLNSSQETVHAEAESGATASAIGDDTEHLSSPEEHSRAEAIVLIRHPPSFHYHGADPFRAETSPHTTNIMAHIELEDDNNFSDNECNELHSLMTGLPRKDSGTSTDKGDV